MNCINEKKNQTYFVIKSTEEFFEEWDNVELFLNALTNCYQNPREVLNRILSVNNKVFVSTDTHNNHIKGYLFYNDKANTEINIADKIYKCIYNGYALINEKYRQTGALQELLEYSVACLKELHEKNGYSLLFYAVTSNPIALRGYYRILKDVSPQISKELTDEDLQVWDFLKSQLFVSTATGSVPFVLKTGLPQRYAASMRRTIKTSLVGEIDYLNSLGVNEENGDRFLFYWLIED